MGEKEGKGDEKNKGENKAAKKEEGPTPVVMKVDMHCEGCALKIKKSVKSFEGVDAVSTDMANNKLTVIGKVDPWKLRDRVESKTRKKVDLISPANPPKKEESKKAESDKGQSDSKDQKKPETKKPKEIPVSTVVLKIRLHCEGCIQRIRKTILRIKGVENVSVDAQKDLVTVKGTMDVSNLPSYLKDKLKRSVEIVPQKKEGGGGGGGGGGDKGGEKKQKDVDGEGEKKEKGKGGDGGGEKKEKVGDGGGDKKAKEGGGDKKDGKKEDGEGEQKQQQQVAVGPVTVEANKMEYYGGGPYGNYRIEMVHAPQMFSDENPNACSVM